VIRLVGTVDGIAVFASPAYCGRQDGEPLRRIYVRIAGHRDHMSGRS
jgi:hypothetical protein